MAFLMLYIADQAKFEVETVKSFLLASSKVRPVAAPRDHTFCCEYQTSEDVFIVRVTNDAETIVLDGGSEAALNAAMFIQKASSAPVRIIDESYSFDHSLEDFENLDSLRRAFFGTDG